jgi:type I restriction enzyme S subunit
MNVKLEDVAIESRETISGSKRGLPIVGLEHLTPNELTLSTWDVDTENTFTKLFRKGQILFGRRRAYLKKAAVAPFDGICSGDITVIEAIADKILPELLPFIIQNDNFFDFAVGKSAGSLSPRAKWEHLRLFEFNLPLFPEQRKLTDLLWAANATREAYKKLLNLTDQIVKSRFVEMFGDPVTNSKGLPTTEFINVVKMQRGFDLPVNQRDKQGDIPIYASNGIIDYHSEAKVYGGGVITGRSGTIGKVYYTLTDYWPLNTTLFPLELNGNNIIYLAYLVEYFNLARFATGSGVPTLNRNIFHSEKIINAPLSLQNRFAEFVNQADKSSFTLRTALTLASKYSKLFMLARG